MTEEAKKTLPPAIKKKPEAEDQAKRAVINVQAPATLHDSLMAVQRSLHTIGKDKSAHKGKYASIKKLWEEIRTTLSDNGFVVSHSIEKEGVRTIATHTTGDKLESFVPFSTQELKPQDKGSEITYYKRYNIAAIFNIIIDEEDDDATSAQAGNTYKKAEVDILGAITKLRSSKTMEELKVFWNGLDKGQRGDSEVEAVKNEMKEKLNIEPA